MAQPATNPKIEELRFRLKSDPKSRLFYQLAEELRKVKTYDEAEHVLRSGLTHNSTYLAAWVSLGRTLREQGKHTDAVEAFAKALQIDPGNAVAARLMGDEYLALGDKVEAIKKYKLCRALMPADEELDALIERLEDEINPVTILRTDAPEPQAEPVAERTQPGIAPAPPAEASPFAAEGASVFAAQDAQPFADAAAEMQHDAQVAVATADVEPMREAHDESPFEEPAASYTSATLDVERPAGMHVEPAPVAAEVAAPWPEEPAPEPPAAPVAEKSTGRPVPANTGKKTKSDRATNPSRICAQRPDIPA